MEFIFLKKKHCWYHKFFSSDTLLKALNSEIVRSRLTRNPQAVRWHIPV